MINANIVREGENVSRIQNPNKQQPSDRRIFRTKANALSDVQNTLHSRPPQFGNPNNSGIKPLSKPSAQSSNFESTFPKKKTTSGRTRSNNTWKELIPSPVVQSDHLEYHNHNLCEQADQFCVNDFLFPYKFSDSQINVLTKAVKNFRAPVTYKVIEPCEDIEIPVVKKSEDTFSVSDLFSDILPIEMEAPSW